MHATGDANLRTCTTRTISELTISDSRKSWKVFLQPTALAHSSPFHLSPCVSFSAPFADSSGLMIDAFFLYHGWNLNIAEADMADAHSETKRFGRSCSLGYPAHKIWERSSWRVQPTLFYTYMKFLTPHGRFARLHQLGRNRVWSLPLKYLGQVEIRVPGTYVLCFWTFFSTWLPSQVLCSAFSQCVPGSSTRNSYQDLADTSARDENYNYLI